MDAVIKVFCVHTEPNYSLPWQRKRQYASTSSGFMVCGPGGERWLLTNAHSVEYSSQARRAEPALNLGTCAQRLGSGTEARGQAGRASRQRPVPAARSRSLRAGRPPRGERRAKTAADTHAPGLTCLAWDVS